MPSTFRIHPAIGVARVGNAEGTGFLGDDAPCFIGPEEPGLPANWNIETGTFKSFKKDGHIKRQGVRFRIFEFAEDGTVIGEVLPGQRSVESITWTVHVANRKASFFNFDNGSGENGDFGTNGARNADIKDAAQRQQLEIDPGPQSVTGVSSGPIVLKNPSAVTNDKIPDLGDISTDDAGRLVFCGGHGNTKQRDGAPLISDYVNNDGWWDDVSDGPVTAVLTLRGGGSVEALSAWVTVGPPDFAPGIANVVSLYETIWDVVVRNPSIPIPNLQMFRAGGSLARLEEQRADWDSNTNRFRTYQPSYVRDIADLFQRAFAAMAVHDPPDVRPRPFHNPLGPQMWADLGDPAASRDVLRKAIFQRMRDPDATVADSTKMPRGLGDEYCDESENPAGSPERSNSRRFFSLTRTQYAMLAAWADSRFNPDGIAPPPMPTIHPGITPEGLDRAVLENCVGGPFYPGIEVSWTIRNPSIYQEPFRFSLGKKIATGDPSVGIPDVTIRPGFLTQQMALPWQADFRDCTREFLTHTSRPDEQTWAMWWAGQRPDDVFPEDSPDEQKPWTRDPHFNASDEDDKRFQEMVDSWWTLGFVTKQHPADKRRWLETERS